MEKKQNAAIRDAKKSDAATLAALAGELGYPTTSDEMERRLEALLSDPQHRIFVAERDGLQGWIHVSMINDLESESFAEIRGLVVSGPYRGSGIGTQLVTAAEKWANEKRCNRIRVRTNVVRVEARAFYKKRGYESKKTQDVFDKSLLPVG